MTDCPFQIGDVVEWASNGAPYGTVTSFKHNYAHLWWIRVDGKPMGTCSSSLRLDTSRGPW